MSEKMSQRLPTRVSVSVNLPMSGGGRAVAADDVADVAGGREGEGAQRETGAAGPWRRVYFVSEDGSVQVVRAGRP